MEEDPAMQFVGREHRPPATADAVVFVNPVEGEFDRVFPLALGDAITGDGAGLRCMFALGMVCSAWPASLWMARTGAPLIAISEQGSGPDDRAAPSSVERPR
jgi:hypothetical protein